MRARNITIMYKCNSEIITAFCNLFKRVWNFLIILKISQVMRDNYHGCDRILSVKLFFKIPVVTNS